MIERTGWRFLCAANRAQVKRYRLTISRPILGNDRGHPLAVERMYILRAGMFIYVCTFSLVRARRNYARSPLATRVEWLEFRRFRQPLLMSVHRTFGPEFTRSQLYSLVSLNRLLDGLPNIFREDVHADHTQLTVWPRLTLSSIVPFPSSFHESRARSRNLSLSSPTRQPIRSPKWVAAANHAFASSLTMRNSVTREIFFWTADYSWRDAFRCFLISIFVRAARLDRFLSSLTRIQRAIYKISLLYFIFLRFFNSQ